MIESHAANNIFFVFVILIYDNRAHNQSVSTRLRLTTLLDAIVLEPYEQQPQTL